MNERMVSEPSGVAFELGAFLTQPGTDTLIIHDRRRQESRQERRSFPQSINLSTPILTVVS